MQKDHGYVFEVFADVPGAQAPQPTATWGRAPHEAVVVVGPDGGTLPDLAYVTAAQIGRPFRTRWVRIPDRHARTTPLRSQLPPETVTHSRKLEGAWGDRQGMCFIASFAFAAGGLPADATPHDGQLW